MLGYINYSKLVEADKYNQVQTMDAESRKNCITPEQRRRAASPEGLESLFTPASVAIVGASSRIGSVGRAVFENILGGDYTGTIYPVNKKAKSVCGVRAYPTLADIPDRVDMAVIIVPAGAVPGVAREAAAVGVKGLVVITAGFKETGADGRKLEEELVAICHENNMRLAGPNCLGVINTDPAVGLNASFARTRANPGNIAFISQSKKVNGGRGRMSECVLR